MSSDESPTHRPRSLTPITIRHPYCWKANRSPATAFGARDGLLETACGILAASNQFDDLYCFLAGKSPSPSEGFMAAFHNGHDRFLDVRIVDTAALISPCPAAKEHAPTCSASPEQEVRIVRGKDDTEVSLKNADSLITSSKIVCCPDHPRLINDYNVIVTLA